MRKREDDIQLIQHIPAVPSILKVVSAVTGMGFAAVARVTHESWVACEVLDNIDFGLKPGGELRIETTICNEIQDSREAVVIRHVSEDPIYCSHHTPAMYGFQSYISMPITLSDGSFFGTLCAIDPNPNPRLTDEVVGMFRLFAELIATHIQSRKRFLASERSLADEKSKLAQSESALRNERDAAGLREQFIAVLGHDLRNPLAALDGGIKLLQRRIDDEKSRTILRMMSASALRMSALINNVLDFARGRLGGGISLEKELMGVDVVLQNVIDELQTAHPDRIIKATFQLDRPFIGDPTRLGQLFSNLLGNALTHGAESQPITVDATSEDQTFKLVVANGGSEIPLEIRERLFQPFQRGQAQQNLQGLGLGLFIASEIAKAHGGTMKVTSNQDVTQFIAEFPISSA